MPPLLKRSFYIALAAISLASISQPAAIADDSSITANAGAALGKEGKQLYLTTKSHSYELAQYAYGSRESTVIVDGEVNRRLRVSDDIGAENQPTGTVRLAIRPIQKDGSFGAVTASRELPGDEIRLDSPAGVAVITYGCCAENSAEAELSLESLKTLYVSAEGIKHSTYTVLGKPALGRVIAIYLAMTPLDDEILGNDKTALGLLTVSGEGDVLERVRVHLRTAQSREAALDWSTEHGWRNASGGLDDHVVVDPSHPSTPIFEWRIADGKTIALPLVNDRLNVAGAKLPEGITLETLSQ
jgi:hypothetical protein